MASRISHEVEKMAAYLPIKMTPELHKLVKKQAKSMGMSATGWVVNIIARELDRNDLAFVPREKSDRMPTNGKVPA